MVLCFGKKSQVCGIMAGDRLDEAQDNVFHVSSRINSTWGGNLADMVRCVRYLEIIHEDDLVANAARVGALLKEGLECLAADFDKVTNARGMGLFLAMDLPDGDLRGQVWQGC